METKILNANETPIQEEEMSERRRQILDGLDAHPNAEHKKTRAERLVDQFMLAFAGAVDAKDAYTNGHSVRVANYSKEIARRLGMSEEEQVNVFMLGMLHDIGKIGMPDEIIHKDSRLSDEEFERIKRHPVIGAEILKNVPEIPELSIGARWHHERYDGNGYPDGLKGEEIPYVARIIAVADAYDAMTSMRAYAKTRPQAEVRAEIENGKGVQFDPVIADVMLQMIDEDVDYLMQAEQETGDSDGVI